MKYKINYKILIPILFLSIISIFTIYSSLTYTSPSLGNLAFKQAIWYLVGWGLVFILVHLKNDYLYQHTWYLYIIGNILLLFLLFFGTPINNSKCWFTIPGIGSIQPSEFMKIFIMLSLATMLGIGDWHIIKNINSLQKSNKIIIGQLDNLLIGDKSIDDYLNKCKILFDIYMSERGNFINRNAGESKIQEKIEVNIKKELSNLNENLIEDLKIETFESKQPFDNNVKIKKKGKKKK